MLDFSLDILGSEWIIIAFVAMVLFFGTKRLPELSRKLGRAMAEYNKTKSMVQNEFQNVAGGSNLTVQGPVQTERQKLETIAKSLGVDFVNKTDEELRNVIASKIGAQSKDQGDESKPKSH